MSIPADFTSVDVALPKSETAVLVIRTSSYTNTKREVLTARYQPEFRPLAPWRDLGGDAITDSGAEVLGWKEAHDWLNA